ncbi:MAG: hypothetical protein FWE54_04895, partial [Methanimicrococcus sp.]|nr:hypothetical protein [Methanimicrococcus sp.]
ETIPGRVSDEVKNGDARRTDATVKPRRCKLNSGNAFDLKARPKLKDAKPNAAVRFNFQIEESKIRMFFESTATEGSLFAGPAQNSRP